MNLKNIFQKLKKHRLLSRRCYLQIHRNTPSTVATSVLWKNIAKKNNWVFKVFYIKDFGTAHAHSELRKEVANSPEYRPLLGINQHQACNYTDFLSSNICSVNCVSCSTAQLLPHLQPHKPCYAALGVLPDPKGILLQDIKNPCPGYVIE